MYLIVVPGCRKARRSASILVPREPPGWDSIGHKKRRCSKREDLNKRNISFRRKPYIEKYFVSRIVSRIFPLFITDPYNTNSSILYVYDIHIHI